MIVSGGQVSPGLIAMKAFNSLIGFMVTNLIPEFEAHRPGRWFPAGHRVYL